MGKTVRKLFQSEDSKFFLACGFKFSTIFLISAIFAYYSLWIIVSINSIYFEASLSQVNVEFRESFFYAVFQFFFSYLPEILAFYFFLFFAGMYIGKVLLRPFELIGTYCESRREGNKVDYNPDYFTDYKLLSRFSEYFFSYIEESLDKEKLSPSTIPSQFTKIHAPSFERVFFFHFLLIILMLAVMSGFFVAYLTLDVQEKVIELFTISMKGVDNNLIYFLENQKEIYSATVVSSCVILFVSYILLSVHLYNKISGAIFGFFATMRAFMKGNTKARVHLIGYTQIRPYGRFMNKFLDHVERKCSIDNNKEQTRN